MSIRYQEGHDYMPTDRDLREVIAPYADEVGSLNAQVTEQEQLIADLLEAARQATDLLALIADFTPVHKQHRFVLVLNLLNTAIEKAQGRS
jgi:hypothetical protein